MSHYIHTYMYILLAVYNLLCYFGSACRSLGFANRLNSTCVVKINWFHFDYPYCTLRCDYYDIYDRAGVFICL